MVETEGPPPNAFEEVRARDLGVLKDFAGLQVAKLLDVQDRARLAAAVERYRHLATGRVEEVEFQREAVRSACQERSGLWKGELATGAGKTHIAADIALEFIAQGDTVYICPNPLALGSLESGIIQKFHWVFNHRGRGDVRIGRLNEPSTTDRIHFFTPMGLMGLQKSSPNLFGRIMEGSVLNVLDEAHHFPEDDDGGLKVFGKVPQIAKRLFLDKGKKVVALTATYGRLDGRPVIGKTPDFKFTVQDSVDVGRCPEVHGLQVYLPFECPNAKDTGSDFDLRLTDEEYTRYWRLVAGYMLEIWRRAPAPMAVFVRLRAEAEYLARVWNESSGLGDRGLRVLTMDIRTRERERVVEGIKKGRLAGYVTCGVGQESLDIPSIEVVHLVVRTRSINKVVQSVGRSLRLWPAKRRSLVVDYQVMRERIIKACNGILEYAKAAGIDPEKAKALPNGGALVAIKGAPSAIAPDAKTFGECEEWIVRGLRRSKGLPDMDRREAMVLCAESGLARPSVNSKGQFMGHPLSGIARAFYQVADPTSAGHEPRLMARITAAPKLHPSWRTLGRTADVEERLRKMAQAGLERPTSRFDVRWLEIWTDPLESRYRKDLDVFLRKTVPRWFVRIHPERVIPPPPELPPDHWLLNGYIDLGAHAADKYAWQDGIRAFLGRGRQFPEHLDLQNPEHYLMVGEKELPDRKDFDLMVKVPMVWPFHLLQDAIAYYSDVDVLGWGKKYDRAFSFEMKLRMPHLKALTSIIPGWGSLRRPDGEVVRAARGLSPWEIRVKEMEYAFFTMSDLDEHECARGLKEFSIFDSEIVDFVRQEVSSLTKNLFDEKIRKAFESVCWQAPDGPRDSVGAPKRTPLEELLGVVYNRFIWGMEKSVLERFGGLESLDDLVQSALCDMRLPFFWTRPMLLDLTQREPEVQRLLETMEPGWWRKRRSPLRERASHEIA